MPDKSMPEAFTRADRDTIIRLDTKFDILIADVRELRDNLVNRVDSLEETRAAKQDLELIKQKASELELRKANHNDIVCLEARVKLLENLKYWLIGVGVCAGIISSLITYIYFSDMHSIKADLEQHIEATK